MSRLCSKRLWIVAGLVAGKLSLASLSAQTTTNSAPPSAPGAPVDLFRELLVMSADEQKEFLDDRSPEDRKRILAKVRQYESLKPDQRELRLSATELRW